MLMYRDHVSRNSSEIISQSVSLWCSLFTDSITDLLHEEYHHFLAGIRVGTEKWLSAYKGSTSLSMERFVHFYSDTKWDNQHTGASVAQPAAVYISDRLLNQPNHD